MSPSAFDWLGLLLICIVLPAAIGYGVSELMRRRGMISDGDYKLM